MNGSIEQQLADHLAKRPPRPSPLPETVHDPIWKAWYGPYCKWVDKRFSLEYLRDKTSSE